MTKISASLRLCVNPFYCHSREGGESSDRQVNPWPDLLDKWFAQRHKGTKSLLCAFVPLCESKMSCVWKYLTMDSRLRGNDKIGCGSNTKPLPFRGGVGVGAVSHALRFPTAPTQRGFWLGPGDRAAALPSPEGEGRRV